MARHRRRRNFGEDDISESCKIFVEKELRLFLNDPDLTTHSFPSTLNNTQRAYIHKKCRDLGLKSKSVGKEPNRVLTISKNTATISTAIDLTLSAKANDVLMRAVNQYELYDNKSTEKNSHNFKQVHLSSTYGRLSYGNLVNVGPIQLRNNLLYFRKKLPSWSCREDFLRNLERNQIIIVTSETGSGKTTQFPQFILEDYYEKNKPCRIICTQPRRISAVSVAERVAKERGEKVGYTVGYQIRLESSLSPKTALIYCTNGVLLRTLMKGDKCLQNVTHIIIDEIHERDRFADFLMICLRESLPKYPNLKLILMSATMNVEMFRSYFLNAYVMAIPGKMFPVQKYYLLDILQKVNYNNCASRTEDIAQNSAQQNSINNVYYDQSVQKDMIAAIDQCIKKGSEEAFAHVLQLILSESAWIDQQNDKGYTVLMAAVLYDNLELVEQLICMGADTKLKTTDGYTAHDWAHYYNKTDVLQLLMLSEYEKPNEASNTFYSQELLSECDRILSKDTIDYDLIAKIVFHIHDKDPVGSILVFLPGYEDILSCQEAITQHELFSFDEFVIFILHGSMQVGSQYEVFNLTPGKQKVILSTNIAETSITIDDVVYVIDSGKMKEKTYDAISGISSLQTLWISKANADQRRGRAGRTRAGECYCLYSQERYNSLLPDRIPEIVRVPLHELCLLTKMLAPQDMPIAEFLDRAMDRPSKRAVESAVLSLISLGALDEDENLTPLGAHILQLSVEPHLGKMLIYSIVLKCLDPVLTIVASLSYKDPFILPADPRSKAISHQKRNEFSAQSLSDHMVLLRVFQEWQQARINGREYAFCHENFISQASMEIIAGNRTQLLKQLRAAGFVHARPPDSIQVLNAHSESWAIVKAALAAGLYPNVACMHSLMIQTKTEKKVHIHNSSSLKGIKLLQKKATSNLWIVYEELVKVRHQSSIKFGTFVTPLTVALMCGQEISETDEEGCITFTIDEWLSFRISSANILKFRGMIDKMVTRKVLNPHAISTTGEKYILSSLMELLTMEDANYNLRQPCGIGVPPKLANFEINNRKLQLRSRNNFEKNGAVPRTYTSSSPIDNWRQSNAEILPCTYSKSFTSNRKENTSVESWQKREDYFSYQMFPSTYTESSAPYTYVSPKTLPSAIENWHQSKGSFDRCCDSYEYAASSSSTDSCSDAEIFRKALKEVERNEQMKAEENPNTFRKTVEEMNAKELQLKKEQATFFQNKYDGPLGASCNFSNSCETLLKALTVTDEKKSQPETVVGMSLKQSLSFEAEYKNIPDNALFYIVKPKTAKSVQISLSQGTWLFSPSMEKKLINLPNKDAYVVLIFSVHHSNAFQGIAHLKSLRRILTDAPHHIKWLSDVQIPYEKTKNLKNMLNNGKSVNINEDGQEIDTFTGRVLCNMFFNPSPDLSHVRPILGCRK